MTPPAPAFVVLVVEDEILIRIGMAEMLQDTGCEVLAAATGDEAMLLVSERPDISVLFSDIAMPGAGRRIDPGAPRPRGAAGRPPHFDVGVARARGGRDALGHLARPQALPCP